MNRQTWDAVVIGGGPAGASSAISLARRGLRVALFETGTYPHDRLCGEFLSPECAELLAQLGVREAVLAHRPVVIHSARLTAPDGTVWEPALPGTAWGISRRTLDAVLAEQAACAGAAVFQSATVRGLSGSLDEGFTLNVETRVQKGQAQAVEVQARAVIGAQGKRSVLDRALRRKFLEKRHSYVAFKAHFHGPPVPGRIDLNAFPGGYCGLSEIEGGALVACLLVEEGVLRARRGPGAQGLDTFINWMSKQNPALRTWFQQAERIHDRWITIAQVPFEPKPPIDKDVLMAGDSAGLIVPLAGNGIAMALTGGMLAADFLTGCLTGELDAIGLRRAYPAAWNRRFGARLRLGRALQPLLLHPRSAALVLRLLNLLPGIGRYLITHTRDQIVEY